jgi:hypothetical protein
MPEDDPVVDEEWGDGGEGEEDDDGDDSLADVDDDDIDQLQDYVDRESDEHPHLRNIFNTLVEGHRRYHVVTKQDGSQTTEASSDPVEDLAGRMLEVMTMPEEADKYYERRRKTILSSQPYSLPQYKGAYSTEIYGKQAPTVVGKRANMIIKDKAVDSVMKPGFHCCDRGCVRQWIAEMGRKQAKVAIKTERYAYASMNNIGRYEKYMGVIESNLEKVMVQPTTGGDKVVQSKNNHHRLGILCLACLSFTDPFAPVSILLAW